MKPTSFSATALQVHEACPARYKAEHIDRSKGFGGTAATLGSSVHGALELYVKQVYLEKNEQPRLEFLIEMFKLSYVQTFGSSNFETVEYMEGYKMLSDWFQRSDFDGVRVISCEVKDNFPVPTSIGEVPFNYIWDRFDEIKPGVFKVVDYKSNRWNIKADDLQKKIQARAYGLAAAIQLKAQKIPYTRIWVEFDMLRHTPVGRVFTHEDNLATWGYILRSAEEIIKTPDDEVQEKLNGECLFCVRKVQCDALKKNVMVGGIHTINSIEDAIDLRAQLDWQKKGLDSLIKDLDTKILAEARERDNHEFESDLNNLIIGVSKQRAVDAEMVEKAIGETLFAKYGGKNFTVTAVDKLLKGKELTDQQKADLRSLIYYKTSEPKVSIVPKNPIDED